MITNICPNVIFFQLPATFLNISWKLGAKMRQLSYACAAALSAANSATFLLKLQKPSASQ